MPYDFFIKQVEDEITKNVDLSREIEDEALKEIITEAVHKKSRDVFINACDREDTVNMIFNKMRRFDALQPLIEDGSISEIMVIGHKNIFYEKEGRIYKSDFYIESDDKLYNIIISMVSKVNRVLNESSPIVDARLKDGSRINAVIPPLSLDGPVLTIRKFPSKPFTMEDLVKKGTLTVECAEFLRKLVEAKYNIFISGGTGSGKTTFLNALSGFIPTHERVVTIEDSAELQIKNIPNLVRLEMKNVNTEGKGGVSIRELIKAALRMRPDRILVGEVRGEEALDMLQAMNTGHDGSLSTGHANSARDMLSRLETMVLCAREIPLEAVRQQISSAIDIIIHLGRQKDMSRKILEICEITGFKDGLIQMSVIYKFTSELEKKSSLTKTYKLDILEGI